MEENQIRSIDGEARIIEDEDDDTKDTNISSKDPVKSNFALKKDSELFEQNYSRFVRSRTRVPPLILQIFVINIYSYEQFT